MVNQTITHQGQVHPTMQRLAGLLPGLFQAPGEFQLIEHGFNRLARIAHRSSDSSVFKRRDVAKIAR